MSSITARMMNITHVMASRANPIGEWKVIYSARIIAIPVSHEAILSRCVIVLSRVVLKVVINKELFGEFFRDERAVIGDLANVLVICSDVVGTVIVGVYDCFVFRCFGVVIVVE